MCATIYLSAARGIGPPFARLKQMNAALVTEIVVKPTQLQDVTTSRRSNASARLIRFVARWDGVKSALSLRRRNVWPVVATGSAIRLKMPVRVRRIAKAIVVATGSVATRKIAVFALKIVGIAPVHAVIKTKHRAVV